MCSTGQARLLCRLNMGYWFNHNVQVLLLAPNAPLRRALSKRAITPLPRRTNASSTNRGEPGYHDKQRSKNSQNQNSKKSSKTKTKTILGGDKTNPKETNTKNNQDLNNTAKPSQAKPSQAKPNPTEPKPNQTKSQKRALPHLPVPLPA